MLVLEAFVVVYNHFIHFCALMLFRDTVVLLYCALYGRKDESISSILCTR